MLRYATWFSGDHLLRGLAGEAFGELGQVLKDGVGPVFIWSVRVCQGFGA